MTKYHLIIETDEGKRLEPEIFEDLNASRQYAIQYAIKSEHGKVFIIYEDKPLIWDAGDHLRGERQPNGSIDWFRVPLMQNI